MICSHHIIFVVVESSNDLLLGSAIEYCPDFSAKIPEHALQEFLHRVIGLSFERPLQQRGARAVSEVQLLTTSAVKLLTRGLHGHWLCNLGKQQKFRSVGARPFFL